MGVIKYFQQPLVQSETPSTVINMGCDLFRHLTKVKYLITVYSESANLVNLRAQLPFGYSNCFVIML